jgi:hypothetical protein
MSLFVDNPKNGKYKEDLSEMPQHFSVISSQSAMRRGKIFVGSTI